jgi:hypothetical protein
MAVARSKLRLHFGLDNFQHERGVLAALQRIKRLGAASRNTWGLWYPAALSLSGIEVYLV